VITLDRAANKHNVYLNNRSNLFVVWGFVLLTGSADDGADPSALDAPIAESVDTAAAGFDHGLIVQDGTLSAFGPSFSSYPNTLMVSIDIPARVMAVAAGEHHSLALTECGDLYAFGSNREGQLGLGTECIGQERKSPVLVLGPGTSAKDGAPIVAVAAGARHSMAVNAQGQSLAWGWSLHGQCGTGSVTPHVPSPTLISALGPLKVVGVAAGMAHSLCLTDSGDVYSWGSNADGALGIGTTLSSLQPQLVESLGAVEDDCVVKVAAGARHSVALCSSGKVVTWGYGAFGQLGTAENGTARGNALKPEQVVVPKDLKVTDIAAGWWHTLLVAAE